MFISHMLRRRRLILSRPVYGTPRWLKYEWEAESVASHIPIPPFVFCASADAVTGSVLHRKVTFRILTYSSNPIGKFSASLQGDLPYGDAVYLWEDDGEGKANITRYRPVNPVVITGTEGQYPDFGMAGPYLYVKPVRRSGGVA